MALRQYFQAFIDGLSSRRIASFLLANKMYDNRQNHQFSFNEHVEDLFLRQKITNKVALGCMKKLWKTRNFVAHAVSFQEHRRLIDEPVLRKIFKPKQVAVFKRFLT